MHLDFDARSLLPTIHTPTLVLHHRNDLVVPFESGRYLADHIPGAVLAELDGVDHLYWVGDQDALLAPLRAFIGGLVGSGISHTARLRPRFGWGALTAAELDIVELVAHGLSNREIARRLYLSPKTVESHLSHIFTKLGLNSRTQLVAAAAAAKHAPGERRT
jgi:DNA-binding CsgD family transcriptional regulator